MAGQLLDAAGVPWTEVFVGGVAAVAAAVMAGLGVAALAPRMLPFGAVDVGRKLGLPGEDVYSHFRREKSAPDFPVAWNLPRHLRHHFYGLGPQSKEPWRKV